LPDPTRSSYQLALSEQAGMSDALDFIVETEVIFQITAQI
jgi:hypothetical protein